MDPVHWIAGTSAKKLAKDLQFLREVREAKDKGVISVQQQNVSDDLLEQVTQAVIGLLIRIHDAENEEPINFDE